MEGYFSRETISLWENERLILSALSPLISSEVGSNIFLHFQVTQTQVQLGASTMDNSQDPFWRGVGEDQYPGKDTYTL